MKPTTKTCSEFIRGWEDSKTQQLCVSFKKDSELCENTKSLNLMPKVISVGLSRKIPYVFQEFFQEFQLCDPDLPLVVSKGAEDGTELCQAHKERH